MAPGANPAKRVLKMSANPANPNELYGAIEVDGAVLHVEHNSVESFPRQSLGDGGLVHGDPSAQGLPARSQTFGEHSQHRLVHSRSHKTLIRR